MIASVKRKGEERCLSITRNRPSFYPSQCGFLRARADGSCARTANRNRVTAARALGVKTMAKRSITGNRYLEWQELKDVAVKERLGWEWRGRERFCEAVTERSG